MALANTTQTYGSVARAFHWTTAALIFVLIPTGIIANDMPYDTADQLAAKAQLFTVHKTIGVLVFFVALARILWAVTQPKPGELHPDRKAETFLAETVHWLLYGSLVIVPLSGWIHHAATTGFAPIWWPFGQSLPFVPKDEGVAATFGSLHWIWTKVLAASVFLHVAGALKHHFIDKDKTLARMCYDTPLPEVSKHAARMGAPMAAIAMVAFSGAAAGALGGYEVETPQAAELADVTSDWQVEDGTLALTVQQFGTAVNGSFANWTADIDFDPETKAGEVEVTIAIGSLSLGSVTSQALGADYFDAEGFPTAIFAGPITHIEGSRYQSAGVLTLKGATMDVTLDFTLDEADGLWTMTGSTELDRRDFAIGMNQSESNLGFGVSVQVDLTATQS